MPSTVQCPHCEERFSKDDQAQEPLQCPHCQHVFSLATSTGIQTGSAPLPASPSKADKNDAPPSRRPSSRSGFPWAPIAFCTSALLLCCLVCSGGVNAWLLIMTPQTLMAHEEARQQQAVAQENAERALQELQISKRALEHVERECDNQRIEVDRLRHELNETRRQLDDAKRGQKK